MTDFPRRNSLKLCMILPKKSFPHTVLSDKRAGIEYSFVSVDPNRHCIVWEPEALCCEHLKAVSGRDSRWHFFFQEIT